MSESKGKLVASIKKKGDVFNAHYEGEDASFDSFEEANQWIIQQEDKATETPEKPASEMSEEDAEEINSNVNTPPVYPGTVANDVGDEVKA